MNKLLIDDTNYLTKDDIFLLKKGKNYNYQTILKNAKEINPYKIISNIKDSNIFYIKNIKKYEKNYLKNNKITPILIGVTGTNGKTSTSTIIYEILKSLNKKVMLIGSNGIYFNDLHFKTRNTTISALSIKYFIDKYLDNDSYLILELSSQGYKRIKHLKFDHIIYTNLSNEHLDYHKTLNRYFKAKLKILNLIKNKENLIINIDDKYGKKIKNIFKNITSYSLNDLKILNNNPIQFIYKNNIINSNLQGDFNIYNLYSSLLLIDKLINKNYYQNIINIKEIKGRNNLIKYNTNNIIIDFAHTPLSMDNIIKFYHSLNPNNLYILFGFGGNKDIKKRPLMLNVALKYTNNIILTEDNSRNEDFINIIKSSLNKEQDNLIIIQDRKEAIKYSLSRLKDNDTLLILGKGNEEYITKKKSNIKHNDYEEVVKWIN